MSRNRGIVLAVAGVALAAFGADLARRAHGGGAHGERASAAGPASGADLRLAWPAGTRWVYDLAVSGTSVVNVGPAEIVGTQHAELDLTGALVVRSLGEEPGRAGATRLAIGFGPLSRHELSVGGSPVLSDEIVHSQLEGHEAFVTVDADGTIAAVKYKKGEGDLFRRLSTMVVREMQVTVPPGAGDRWTTTETGPNGRGPVNYARQGGATSLELSRERTAYDTLSSVPDPDHKLTQRLLDAGTVRLAPAGFVDAIDDEERLQVLRPDGKPAFRSLAKFHLARRELNRFVVGTGDLLSAADLEDGPGDKPTATETKRMLEDQAAGMTGADLERQIRLTVVLGGAPDDKGWMARAVAVLKLHPELCQELADMFGDQIDGHGMGLVLDVLVATGTPEAQAAMRAALETDVARKSPETYVALLQRWGYVTQPDAESVEAVRGEYARGRTLRDADLAHAAAFSLGAMAGHLATDGEPADRARSRALRDELEHELAGGDVADRAALAAGLGNGGVAEDLPRLVDLGHDSDPGVREAAAQGLRKLPTPDARRAVIAMLSDSDPNVQNMAIHTLTFMPVDEGDVVAVCAIVTAGRLAPLARREGARFLAAHLEVGAPVRGALLALLEVATDDPSLQAAIRQSLG